jgi:tetratricopeptide (TPR) repeat protein
MAADPTSYEARELNWQIYTKAGNQQMQTQSYAEAQQIYSLALAMAELLLEEAKASLHHPEAIHPYVVSHHNLIDAYSHLGLASQAEDTLNKVYRQVTCVMNDPNLPPKLRLEAFRALKIVAFETHRFYREINQAATAEAQFAQMQQQAQDFLATFDLTLVESSQSVGLAQFPTPSSDL